MVPSCIFVEFTAYYQISHYYLIGLWNFDLKGLFLALRALKPNGLLEKAGASGSSPTLYSSSASAM